MNDATLNIIIKAKDQATAAVKSVGSSLSSAADQIGAAGARANEIGKDLTAKVTLPIVAAGGAAIKMSTDFNSAMANVASLIPGNTQRVEELKTAVQNMAIATGKSTTDLAGGLYQVISAFGNTADTAKILETNAKAAAAGVATTTDAINLTSSVTKGYGDTSAEAVKHASDLALMTVRLGQTTFPELAASIGRVTPLAASLNVSQQELFGTMATFTGVTGGAAEVSTQLRGVLQALMAPTDGAQKLMQKLGYENGQAMIKGLGLQGTIEALTNEAKKTGAPLQDFIGSIEGQTLALAATGGQADTYREKIAAMGNVAGTTDQAFAEQTQGINKAGFAMQQAQQKAAVAAQKMGDALAPAIMKVSAEVSKVADWFSKLSPKGQKVVLIVGAIVAAIGPALIIIGKLAMGIRAISAAFTFLAANPVVLVIMAIVLAIAAVAFLIIKNWDTLKGWFNAFWQFMVSMWQSIWGTIKGVWDAVYNVISTVFSAIWAVISVYIQIYVTAFNIVLTVFTYIFQVIRGIVIVVFSFLWDNVIKPYIDLWVGAFQFVWNIVSSVFNSVRDFIAGVFSWIWNNAINPVLSWVRGAFNSVWDVAKSVFDKISNVVGGVAGSISNAFSNGFESAKNIAKGAVNWMIDKINAVIRGVNNTAGKLPGVPDIPQIPRLATGTSNFAGGVAMVGERGRELVTLPKGAQVIPNSRTERILSQGQQQQQPNIYITNNNEFKRDTDPIAFARMQAYELSRR